MTTIQPLKNEQAVVTMFSKQTMTPLTASNPLLQSSSDIGKAGGAYTAGKDVLSGSVTASVKETASDRLVAIQSGKDSSKIEVLAARTGKAIEAQMEAAKQQMDEIVNSYPPFLRGSEKRQQYLMSISSIRQQIEAMIIPPIKADQLDPSSGGEAKKMWAILFQKVGIPALEVGGANEASDAQIRVASSMVGTMKSQLSSRRAALERQLAPPTSVSEPAAQHLSQEARQGLANTGLSLTSNFTEALKGM